MHRIYRISVLLVFSLLSSKLILAQQDTLPVSVNPALLEIFKSRYPKQYSIAGISVTGTRAFDQNLIISISGLAVGDKVTIPGSDAFGKAIQKLWRQNLVSDVKINFTNLVNDNQLYIEIELLERPRLLDFTFSGIKKGEKDDLAGKVGLARDRVLTENMKLSAVEAIRKFYFGKGYRNVQISMREEELTGIANSVS
ncbi:MAG TPA: outer membrane protein assembly factor, partial [Ferruginibacter sp.]|nr:outer membrane protein assembly factor [Ferruginibacter sp.]